MKINMKNSLILILLLLLAFLSCESLKKKTFYHTDLDFDTKIFIGTRIYYGDVYVGRVSKIYISIEKKEKEVEFFLFVEYSDIGREGSKIIFKVDSDNIVKWIDIVTEIDFENSIKLPEGGYFISTIDHLENF